jgi:hypothetical protein
MIINIISATKGGGAELVVRELHKRYLNKNIDSRVTYLSGTSFDMEGDEEVIGVNPRNPFNILRIRKKLKLFIKQSRSEIIVHARLTWPFFYVALATIEGWGLTPRGHTKNYLK